MAGPHGKAMPGAKSQVENPGKIFMRVLRYVFSKYKIQSIIVVVCIILVWKFTVLTIIAALVLAAVWFFVLDEKKKKEDED